LNHNIQLFSICISENQKNKFSGTGSHCHHKHCLFFLSRLNKLLTNICKPVFFLYPNLYSGVILFLYPFKYRLLDIVFSVKRSFAIKLKDKAHCLQCQKKFCNQTQRQSSDAWSLLETTKADREK